MALTSRLKYVKVMTIILVVNCYFGYNPLFLQPENNNIQNT